MQCDQSNAKADVKKIIHERLNDTLSAAVDALPPDLRYSVQLVQEKGASTWLSALPISEHGLSLHKAAF